MDKLVTHNIAFDTQFIINQNFLKGYLLNEFVNSIRRDGIKLHITEVVYKETIHNFYQGLLKAKEKNDKRQIESLYILKNLGNYEGYFGLPEIDVELGLKEFTNLFDKWITKHNVNVIPVGQIDMKKILNDYFDGNFPFEEKKNMNSQTP